MGAPSLLFWKKPTGGKMKYQIKRAVVIGAGTMGAGIAAHLANAGVPVALLDIVPNSLTPEEEKRGLSLNDSEVRNRIVKQGYERALKSKPASFFTADHAALVSLGNLEDDFESVGKADWIIEVIVENLKIKQNLMERIEGVRKDYSIVSTNTSGIPVHEIAAGRSDSFKKHFLGTHFFNPPRYLKLLEVIPTGDTLPEVVDAVSRFGEYRLGKGIVLAKDTPNFIGNRLGFGGGAFALHYILEKGLTVEEVDAVTGPVIGRPKTSTFRLIDLVGVDVWEHVGSNLAPAIPHDKMAQRYLNSEPANALIHDMVEKGRLGNKTKQGFYKEVRQDDGSKQFWALDLSTYEYRPPQKSDLPSLKKAKGMDDWRESLQFLLTAEDKAGGLIRALTYQGLAYASSVIPEIADTPRPLDDAMRWGFGHQAGPFEIWDILGVRETADCMDRAGFPPASWVKEMLGEGKETFYEYEGERKKGVFNPARREYEAIPRPPEMIILKEEKEAGKVIAKNSGASLIDLGDGVACLEFHTKMNVWDEDIANMYTQALDTVEAEFEGLVVGNDADNFSAGANLFMVVMAAQNGMWEMLEAAVKKMQDINMRSRYFPKPVVIAPVGLALGGGAEVIMHGGRVVAGAELYTGLVEIGAGVIPAGGGTKEMLRRILNPPMRTQNADPFPFLQRIFEQVGMAKVAVSAEEARQFGILGPADRVVMNRSHLLAEARREVLCMAAAGYHPPIPEKIFAAGRDALSGLRVGIYMFKESKNITEHESLIAEKLAYVMTGGEFSRPAWVDEQYILDLERQAFLSLCGEEKTQQRMWNLLQTGKPLRN
jgi:3-hydroxyacyl-CoA dehydrogenase